MEDRVRDTQRECGFEEDPQRNARAAEVADLVALYKGGGAGAKAARDGLVLKMYPLVKSISRRLTVEADSHLERDDLIQEGVLGLMHALERFDPDLGYQFSTYAYHIIFDYMRVLVRKSRTVRLPSGLAKQANKLRAIAARLTSRLGREPSVREIAVEAQIPVGKAATILSTHTISSEISLRDSGDSAVSLFDRITDENDPGVERSVERLRVHPRLEATFRFLSPRHAEALSRHFGLDGKPESLAEIARDWGCSRQNVQRLAADGIEKLRKTLALDGV